MGTISLQKGGNISLSKNTPNMKEALVGLGWDARTTDGAEFDLDASAIVCDASGKALSDQHFVFYNNPADPTDSVRYGGDNRTGEGDGDDETITINLENLSPEADKVVIVVSIYDAENRNQSFGQVSNAYVRVVDNENQSGEEVRFDLGEDFSTERSVVFAEIYRKDAEWKFRAIGQGYSSGLAGVVSDYGLNAS